MHFPRTGLLPTISGVQFAVGVTKETVKLFSFLASPFVKKGSRGIFINHRSLIFNDYFLVDPISPNPSLLKRGNNKNTFTASKATPTE